jgi:NADPH:quinone reductase-like Zn-dependent oxidoreductase
MKAIIVADKNKLVLQDVPKPKKASPGHLLIKMLSCGINSGDRLFIAGAFPRGIPVSRHDIGGVSGVGTVIETGEGVPGNYKGKNVTVYRSLRFSEDTVGTWSEYAHLHYLNCAVIPGNVKTVANVGSLVNIITPYAFLQHAMSEGHKGIICTAGNAATGKAMLGICLANKFPIVSIVRNENAEKELRSLGATNILVQQDEDFDGQLKEISHQLNATAIFDGVGGKLLTRMIDKIPFNSTIYCYGFLDGETAFGFSTKLLMRGITIKGFSNFRTQTVLDEKKLAVALNAITDIITLPHFLTKTQKEFGFEEVNEAMAFSSSGGKGVLVNYD